MRGRWIGILLFGLAAAMPAGHLHAGYFAVPEGFVVEPPETAAAGNEAAGQEADWRPILVIRPEDGIFAGLSTIHLREALGSIEDPDTWLRDRVTADFGSETEVAEALRSPDSPFGDPAFDSLRDALPKLFAGLNRVGETPLEFCEGPADAYNAAGSLREMYCVYGIGPIRQYLVLRLQNVNGRWYYTQIRAANERRLRHLIAIANSFRATL
jgi:hypothetical protein